MSKFRLFSQSTISVIIALQKSLLKPGKAILARLLTVVTVAGDT